METFDKCKTIRRILINRTAEVIAYDSWSDEFSAKQIKNLPEDIKKMEGGDELFGIQPAEMSDCQLESLGFGKWEEGNPMRLIPLWLFPFIADKVETECIDGEKKVTKKKDMDNDHRFGCIAYGVIPKF